MAELPPDISILLLNGIFFSQFAVDVFTGLCGVKRHRDDYGSIEEEQNLLPTPNSSPRAKVVPIGKCNIFITFIAMFLQLFSLLVFVFLWSFRFMSFEVTGYKFLYRLRPMIGLVVCLIFFSVIWTNKFQELLQTKKMTDPDGTKNTARYKSCKPVIIIII